MHIYIRHFFLLDSCSMKGVMIENILDVNLKFLVKRNVLYMHDVACLAAIYTVFNILHINYQASISNFRYAQSTVFNILYIN